MMSEEKYKGLVNLCGGDQQMLDDLLDQIAATDKAARDRGIAYKSTSRPQTFHDFMGQLSAHLVARKGNPYD